MYQILKPFNSRLQKYAASDNPLPLREDDVAPHRLADLVTSNFIAPHTPEQVVAPPAKLAGEFEPRPDVDPKKRTGKE